MPVRMITPAVMPFAIVTPDRRWHSRGEMGWFGFSSDDKEDLEWQKEVEKILADHNDCIAVVVDCHI